MTESNRAIDSARSLAGACSLGVLGVMVFAILPLLLGVVADQLQLNESETGLVASTYFGAFFLMTLTSVIWARRIDWRWLVGGGTLTMVGGLGYAATELTYNGVLLGLSLSGLGAAVLYALSVTLVSDMKAKDRAFAIKLIPEQAIPAILLVLLPGLVVVQYGLPGVLICLLLLALVVVGPGFLIPARGDHQVPEVADTRGSTALVFAGLGGLVMFFAGFASLWAFAERMAHEALDQELVGQLLALGLVGSAVGPIAAAWLGDRKGRKAPILVGSILSLLSLGLMVEPVTALKFGLLMAILPAAFYFAISYLFGIISDADVSGRYSSLISSALALGAAVGPGVFGFVLEQQGAQAGYSMVAGCLIVGCLLFLWIERRLEQHQLHSFGYEQFS